jgi:ferredoxin
LPLRVLFAPFLFRALQPDRWANEYHGKVMPTGAARRLVAIGEEIEEAVPEQVIPFASARDLILSEPDHIVALDCPCRVAREAPCLPLDVCLIVGEPFASFVLEHHPTRSRAIASEEAVSILEEEAQRGHVHHAFFKEALLGRFYAICNCCSCCCGAMSAQRLGTPMLISSGYVAKVDLSSCVSCGTCESVCPFSAAAVGTTAIVDADQCMGCGVCVRACPQKALSLRRDTAKPAPLEVPSRAGEQSPTTAQARA